MLILVTTLGIFTFTDAKEARLFEADVSEHGRFWPFFTILNWGEGAQPC